MTISWQLASISRQNSPIIGSPFLVKLRYRRLHIEPTIAPIAVKRPVQEFLIFQNVNASVEVGDLASLADGTLVKIIDVRSYPNSLQCMLLRTAYTSVPIWTPCQPTVQIGSDKSLSDVRYNSSGSVLAVLEPHAEMLPQALPFGVIDRRRCWVYSAQMLLVQTALLYAGDYWLVTESSGIWPVSSDFRASAVRLALPPLGVA